jgi:hypothetical protein
MAAAVVDTTSIVVYGAQPPTDTDWCSYLALVERYRVESTLHVVATAGGRPTGTQRRQLVDALAPRVIRVAVLSTSPLVRLVANVLPLFGGKARGFAPWEEREALDYLEIAGVQRALVLIQRDQLWEQLGAP